MLERGLTDYHMHLENGPLSLEYLQEFVDRAEKEGVNYLGISEHGYRFRETASILDNEWVRARRQSSIEEYLTFLEAANRQGLTVQKGLELDFVPDKNAEMAAFIEQYDFDYVIGSIHWLGDFPIDLSPDLWKNRDVEEIYTQYFDYVVMLAETDLFDVIGHIDLVKIFGIVPQDQRFLEKQYQRAAAALARSKTCLEVSTAGLRKPVGRIYPEPELLAICREYRVPIVFASDAHYPEHVGYAYDQAAELARTVGYDEITVLGASGRRQIEISL